MIMLLYYLWEDQMVQRRKDLLVRWMKLANDFLQTNSTPEWMVLDLLPVLPPGLRPIVELYEGDINFLNVKRALGMTGSLQDDIIN